MNTPKTDPNEPDFRKLCEELVSQLEDREWHSYGDPGDRWEACPCCSGMKERGHESWCELNTILTRAKQALNQEQQ